MPFGRWVRAVPRWALSQVLDVIAPPYTSDFVQLFLPILENDSIAGTIKTEGEHDPVTEFIGGFCPGASAAHGTYSMLGRHSSSKSDFSAAFKSLWFRGSCLITAQLSTSFCQKGDIAESRF